MKENLERLRTRFVLRACVPAALLLLGYGVVVQVWRRGSSGIILSVFLAALLAVIVTRVLSAIWSVSGCELLKELRQPLRIAGHKFAASKSLDSSFEELSMYLGATARRSQRSEEQRSRLMEDLFHALSQPLTSLRCQLELGLGGSRSAEEYRDYLTRALEQVERTAGLMVQLRDVSEAMEADVGNEPRVFDETFAAVVEEITALANIKDVRMNAEPVPLLTMSSHRERLSQALFHALKFAVESAAPATEMTLRTAISGSGLIFTVVSKVASAGSTAEAEDEERNAPATFDLRLAEYIVEAMGGTLEREQVPDKHILRLKLPAARDAKGNISRADRNAVGSIAARADA